MKNLRSGIRGLSHAVAGAIPMAATNIASLRLLHILSHMWLINHATEFPPSAKESVLCVGNFDGVHLGHQRMLAEAKSLARKRNLHFVVMTFHPHPLHILRPNLPRRPLMTVTQRMEILQGFEPDVLWVVKTDQDFLNMTADEFMHNILVKTIAAKAVVEGGNFTFGKGALGTVTTLQENGRSFGWETIIVPTQKAVLRDLSLVDVSSSLIRWLISQGRVADATRLMGRPYTLRGVVARGAGRGTTIGYPTLNIQCEQLLPAPGVYAGQAVLAEQTYAAAISVGNNPTFNGTALTVEAFVLDFSGSVYDQRVEVRFTHWLRDQYKFSGVEALKAQIQRDVDQVRHAATNSLAHVSPSSETRGETSVPDQSNLADAAN